MRKHATDVMRTVGHAVTGLSNIKALVPSMRRNLPPHAMRCSVLASRCSVLTSLARLCPVLEALGGRHAGYGVIPAHFDIVGQALLWTLEQGLGELWTPEVSDCIARAFEAGCPALTQIVARVPGQGRVDDDVHGGGQGDGAEREAGR